MEIFSTAYLMGGLGNQMFQIAHAKAQGLKKGVKTIFTKNCFTPMQASKPTKYLDNIYKKIEFVDSLTNTTRISESGWNNPNLNFDWDTPIEFYGYFQSSKNFLEYQNEIQELFQPSEDFITKTYNEYPDLQNECISLHIRRGDYLKIKHVLPTVDISYINEALLRCDKNQKVFLFSDDKEFLKSNFNDSRFIIVDDKEDYEELWMMSLCNTNIISNSTFSWWGAYLNKNKNKKVFMPSQWFGPSGPNPHDSIFEDDWEKINVKYIDGKLCY